MLDRALAHFVGFRRSVAQPLNQLIQEQGYAAIDLHVGGPRSRPLGHFRSATADEFIAIQTNEFSERERRHSLGSYASQEGGDIRYSTPLFLICERHNRRCSSRV